MLVNCRGTGPVIEYQPPRARTVANGSDRHHGPVESGDVHIARAKAVHTMRGVEILDAHARVAAKPSV